MGQVSAFHFNAGPFGCALGPGPIYWHVPPMSLIKSKQRVADHGEVFTPAWMVEPMLDLAKDEANRIDARFLEPAFGGNLLILRRHYALIALVCTSGNELQADNIAECRAAAVLEVLA